MSTLHGVLNIRKSKGYDQHYVALHKSMTELLKQYDKVAETIRPDRTYFFETPNGKYYSRQWVTQTFQCLWEKANGKHNKAVAYDLRYPNHYKIQTFSIDAVYAVGFFEKKVWILFFLFGTPQPTEINQ